MTFRLPVDVYQTAKVSKLLLMIENGVPIEHKGKSLSEIDIDFKYAEENDLNMLKRHYDDRVQIKEIDDDLEKKQSYEDIDLDKLSEKDKLNRKESGKKRQGKMRISSSNNLLD